jgi:hypothetical protein
MATSSVIGTLVSIGYSMMNKICPGLECSECMWYRPFLMTNREAGTTKHKMCCGIEVLLEYIPQIVGAVDGCQQAANESRNYVFTMARGMAKHGVDEPLRMLMQHEGVKEIGGDETLRDRALPGSDAEHSGSDASSGSGQ